MVSDGSSGWDKLWSCTYWKDRVILECIYSIYDTHIVADIRQKGIVLQYCYEKFLKLFVHFITVSCFWWLHVIDINIVSVFAITVLFRENEVDRFHCVCSRHWSSVAGTRWPLLICVMVRLPVSIHCHVSQLANQSLVTSTVMAGPTSLSSVQKGECWCLLLITCVACWSVLSAVHCVGKEMKFYFLTYLLKNLTILNKRSHDVAWEMTNYFWHI